MLDRAPLRLKGGHRLSDDRLRRIDWDFIDSQSESPFSALHWHPCRFVSQIPASIIGILCPPGGTVLDPFCGSGTVLVEAQRLDRQAIGIDLNPVSCLVTQAKTSDAAATEVQTSIRNALRKVDYLSRSSDKPQISPPATVQLEKWYSPGVARQLTSIWALISNIRDGLEKLFISAAFSSILMTVCRETRHWGYVCDNTQPKGHKERNCFAEMSGRLKALSAAYEARDKYLSQSGRFGIMPAHVHCGDAVDQLNALESESVDLVITSPPYFGVADYIKSQRLSFEWFGHNIEEHRRLEIGARSKRHRVTAAADYRGEISAALGAARRVLKTGGFAVFVFGESTARESTVRDMDKLLLATGFNLRHEITRTISIRRRQRPSLSEERIFITEREG